MVRGYLINVRYLFVVRKWFQQAHVFEYLAGESRAMKMSSSISEILLICLKHSGMVVIRGEPQCRGIHILAALIRVSVL